MTVAVGANCYSVGASPCKGTGLVWTDEELDDAISGPVAAVVFDDAGKADIATLLAGVAETEFAQERLAAVLSDPDDIEDWRVGEAIAETYLTDHRSCTFPWPDGRDERKAGSSLPGADLVGFQTDEHGDRFAFGEVKTSGEARHPPGAVYGRTGLKQQLEDLRDKRPIRDGLMKYLGHRAGAAVWRDRYRAASRRYLANSSDVQLFGILIRDVGPHEDDVRVRVDKLATGCPTDTAIELLALYMPPGSIAKLSAKALATRAGGGV
ncbi:hypothetical protein [Thiococcus pfennigii]|uniref:hypothetical protein n=1 Tax=Thiococcus pfennigii TaxID=1057 RepID=UPI001906C883|nr:hypothetical protein [Thiococcus pfennigii]MBK1700238.1 hypothetical protein [Thiococcus pfennigii]